METITKESAIVLKAQDLCQAIIDHEGFGVLKQRLDAFLADEALKAQFQQLHELGEMLHHRQSQGQPLAPNEIAQFETLREALMSNPVATGFLEAQDQVKNIHQMVGRFLEKTFEMGRQPEFCDVTQESCGNCDCH